MEKDILSVLSVVDNFNVLKYMKWVLQCEVLHARLLVASVWSATNNKKILITVT